MNKRIWILALVAILAIIMIAGCATEDKSVKKEQDQVSRQQLVYTDNQPAPWFDYSLQRDLWVQFYKAANESVSTWTYITDQFGNLRFETPSQGYPIPYDTQLTNPWKTTTQHIGNGNWIDGVVSQAEPNGLFTGQNTDATIVMATNDDGTLSPIYTELKTTAFPFPVRWDDKLGRWIRIEGGKPTITLTIKKK